MANRTSTASAGPTTRIPRSPTPMRVSTARDRARRRNCIFLGHALMENRNGLIVGAVTTRASGHAERLAALALIEPHADRPQPVTLGADKGYDAGAFFRVCP